MLGLIQKLLYVLTLSPFEKAVKQAKASSLNFDPLTFRDVGTDLRNGNSLKANPDEGFQIMDLAWERSGGGIMTPDFQRLAEVRSRVKREVYPVHPYYNYNLTEEERKARDEAIKKEEEKRRKEEEERRKEQEELDRYNRQVRIIRVGIWSYILYSATVCWFFGGVAGTEDLVLYMKRVAAMMVVAAAVDLTKYFFDLRVDPNMKRAADMLILLLGIGATTQVVLSIPQFYYELSKLF